MTAAYDAAGQGRRLKFWPASRLGPNAIHAANSGTIVSRTRERVRNDGWAASAIVRRVSNAVATGIHFEPTWGSPKLRKAIKRQFELWAPKADADGALDAYGMQALAWSAWEEAGEVFVRVRHRRPEDGLNVPVQFQLIEAEQCPAHYNTLAPNGNRIKQGIEIDRIGRRVAYWMHRAHPGEVLTLGEVNASELVRIPAEQILHLYRPIRPGALRGLPRMSVALVDLFNLDNLRDAVLMRQQIANLYAGFYTRKVGAEEDSPLEDAHIGDDEDGTPMAGLEPGTMQELPEGVDPKFSAPPGPGDTYAEFMRQGIMKFAATVGVPYEVLTGDLRDVSDRALRLILNEFKRLIEQDQWLYFIPQLLQGMLNEWLDAAALAGVLPLSAGAYQEHRDEIATVTWVPEGWPYSHPVQDVDADLKAIRGGLTSRTKVVRKNGYDAAEIDAEQAADNARADSLGLPYDSDARQKVRDGQQDRPAPSSNSTRTEEESNA